MSERSIIHGIGSDGFPHPITIDSTVNTGGNLSTTLGTKLAGEDITNDVMKVEYRYSQTRCTADTQVKASAGYIKRIRITQPSSTAPTAGVLTVYDSTAESGTILLQQYIPNTAITMPYVFEMDIPTTNGIYVGFDATLANVVVTVAWR